MSKENSMRDKILALSGVGLMALAAAAMPTAAQAADGSVTLSAEQWQAIQAQMAQDHKDIQDLKAALQASNQKATQAQATATQANETAKKADEKAKVYGGCGPRLNPEKPASDWLGKGGAKAKLANEKPKGETIAYDELIKRWSKK